MGRVPPRNAPVQIPYYALASSRGGRSDKTARAIARKRDPLELFLRQLTRRRPIPRNIRYYFLVVQVEKPVYSGETFRYVVTSCCARILLSNRGRSPRNKNMELFFQSFSIFVSVIKPEILKIRRISHLFLLLRCNEKK